MAYLHLVEPRISGNTDRECEKDQSLDFALKAWDGASSVILAGGYNADSGNIRIEELGNVAIAFGRQFTSNPDLPQRLLEKLPLTSYDRSTFYVPESAKGYTTWSNYAHESEPDGSEQSAIASAA